ncbi:hypothetical protein H4R18_004897 [Coemansia javaensis]|uniref:Uncharacterized protein n=1 Tax=Coemansia javaensis TaxID=2761396 RepID=A0A9W8LE56_9FUNG|nr:hypothetical protein H4R18_004897 [Coemansia javaensis]
MPRGPAKRDPDGAQLEPLAKRRRRRRRQGSAAAAVLDTAAALDTAAGGSAAGAAEACAAQTPTGSVSGLEQSMRRVTFADDGRSGASQATDSDHSMAVDLGLPSPTPLPPSSPAEAAARARPAPARGRKVDNPRYSVKSSHEAHPAVEAARTMAALVLERDRCLTRRIVLAANAGARPGQSQSQKHKQSHQQTREALRWPCAALHRYLRRAATDAYGAMGIGLAAEGSPHATQVALEEPGEEWETAELHQRPTDSNSGNSSATVDIADPLANGGIGLVVSRRHGDIEFVTKARLMHPRLRGPRYSRVPLPDEFQAAGLGSDAVSAASPGHLQPLVDMTRVQVLNQILALRREPMPLSRFVSCTVAEEAVAGLARTWAVLDRRLRAAPRGAPTEPQWIAVLRAALDAGVPPEAVARAYRRLAALLPRE